MEAQQSRKFSKVSAIRLTQGAATLSVGMNTTVSILTDYILFCRTSSYSGWLIEKTQQNTAKSTTI